MGGIGRWAKPKRNTVWINPLKYARIKSIVVGIYSIGFLVLMVWFFINAITTKGQFNHWVWLAFYFPTYFALIIAPLRETLAVSDAEHVEWYIQVFWKKYNRRRLPRPSANQLIIRQDSERYYCLLLLAGPVEEYLLERYPTLKSAEERLTLFRQALCF